MSDNKMYALFHHDRQASKSHPYREVAEMEAYERGVVVSSRYGRHITNGYTVKETG